MISPYVRRRRLAAELLRLRERNGYSAADLAKAIGVARQRISRLENGHIAPDLDEIMRILELFGVGKKQWTTIMAIARDSQERGWWEKFSDQMGPRQALYANLEAGAARINEYQMALLPGLLQVPSFTEIRINADRAIYSEHFEPARALHARAARQRVLNRPDGPVYEVIIDELAIRRPAAPPHVVRVQLDHLVHIGHTRKKLTIRVLPIAASIANHAVPRSAFSVYRYPDADDPTVVAVDTVTSDLVLTDGFDVARYLDLYVHLQAAAMGPVDSLDFLARTADELSE